MTSKVNLSSIDLATYSLITALCAIKLATNDQLASIVTDEIQYKEIILGLKEPHLFNPVFYALYAITKYASEGWYLGVRLINLIFIYASTEAIRRICILYEIKGLKRLIVFSTMLCTGITTYMLNIMPETMYVAGIYWTIYALLTQIKWELKTTILISVIASSLSLIKPHAILLYPIIVVTFMWGVRPTSNIKIVEHIVLTITIFVAVRWGIGWLLSGEISLGLFGGAYETLGNKNILKGLINTFYVINRHTYSWVLIMPFVVTWIYTLLKGIAGRNFKRREAMLHIFACGALLSSVIVFSMFTSSVNTNENMQILRIHLRYYSFIVPIVVISAIAIESKVTEIVKRREIILVNIFIILILLIANLALNNVYTIRGNWVDSPILINITSRNDILFLTTISVILVIFTSLKKNIMIPIFYTTILLALAEMRQWNISYKMMKDTIVETRLHNYINLKTKGQAFEVLVKGRNNSSQSSTKNEMIDCIKIVMLQTKRTFKDVCIKEIKDSSSRHLIAFSHIDYGSLLENYCKLEEITPGGSNGIALLVKKDYTWKNLDINTENQKNITLNGFHKQETWGRWAKKKWTYITPKQYMSGDIHVEFKARSLLNSKVRIGNKIIKLDKDWKKVRYSIEGIECLDTIAIEYIGEKSNIEGRDLAYAIKDLKLINKNE